MAAFVYTLPNDFTPVADAFARVIDGQANTEKLQIPDTSKSIRRPLRGTERKDDSYASIRIVSSSGSVKTGITNSSRRSSDTFAGYYNFLLQAYAEQRVEKSQIIETFGQSYVYFYGERTPVIQFQGVLLNTKDFNWKSEFLQNYENHFRGTRLVAGKYRAFIRVDDDLFGGYLMDMSVNTNAQTPEEVPFTFTLLVTDRALLNVGSRNSTAADSTGPAVQIPPLPEYNRPKRRTEKGGFLSTLRSIKDGLNGAIDDGLGYLRVLSSGRRIRVPDADFNAADDLQIATRSVTLAGGTIQRTALLRGETIKILPRDNYVYGTNGTGNVTENTDEYIDGGSNNAAKPFLPNDPRNKPEDTSKALRTFLKKNGIADYKVDGLPAYASILGRVTFGVAGSVLTQNVIG
jgi:hypothetical protein